MKFGVTVFPGSNCDHDTYNVIESIAHQPVTFLWHDSPDLQGVDAILVPGGFAYGDYLRTGAIARFSPVMESVKKFAAKGGLVLGMMPHPDRSSERILGSADGWKIFESMVGALARS